MAGFPRFVAVLRLFNETQSALSVQEMSVALEVPVSTMYRTVKELVKASFLEQAPESRYRLGEAFIEFDRLVRVTDPLVQSGRPILHDMVLQARVPCVALLSRVYNNRIMCVADEAAGDVHFRWSYQRGQPMPLTSGSASKVVLAHLSAVQRRKLFAASGPDAQRATSSKEFRDLLRTIRKSGYYVSHGEIDRGLMGIAAPVIAPALGLTCSVSVIVEVARIDETDERRLVLMLVSAGSLVSENLRRGRFRDQLHAMKGVG
jgi:DNA-binding IclR family transcriptional regulator